MDLVICAESPKADLPSSPQNLLTIVGTIVGFVKMTRRNKMIETVGGLLVPILPLL